MRDINKHFPQKDEKKKFRPKASHTGCPITVFQFEKKKKKFQKTAKPSVRLKGTYLNDMTMISKIHSISPESLHALMRCEIK